MEFQHILDVLLKRRRVFVAVFLAFFFSVVAVTISSKPVYKATVKMLVEIGSDPQVAILGSIGMKTAGGLNTNTSTNTSSSGDYDTDVALASIRPLLEKVTNELHLKARNGKALKPEKLVKLGFLRKTILPQPYINIAQYEDAQMVKIEAFSTNPEEALQMSNLLARYYVEDRIARTKAEFGHAKRLVQSKIQEVMADYRNQLSKTADYKQQAGLVDVDKETSAVINRVYSLQSNNEENEKSIIELDKKLALDREKLKEVKPLRMDSQEMVQSDLIRYVQEKFGDLNISLAEKSVDLTKEHPDYKALERKIDAVKELVKAEVSNGDKLKLNSEKYTADPVYDDLYKKTYTDLIDREAALVKRAVFKKYIGEYQKFMMTYSTKFKEMSELDAETSVYKTTYQNLLGALKDLSIAEAISMTNINIVEHATLPEDRHFPSSMLNYVAGIVLGFLVALGAVFFVDYADTTVRTGSDIQRNGNMSFLGSIPDSSLINTARTATGYPVSSGEAEAFRAVRNHMRFELREKPVKSIAVASLHRFEGASTVAANLAILSADQKNKVLLVDCNVMNPALHTLFQIENSQGLSEVLSGKLELKQAIASTGINNLSLLPSGIPPLDPSGAIESPRMRDIIRELEAMYDLIVIDTAPMALFSNTMVIGTMVGGMVQVAEYGRATYQQFERMRQIMDRAGLPIIGGVLNKEDAVTYATLLSAMIGTVRAALSRMRGAKA